MTSYRYYRLLDDLEAEGLTSPEARWRHPEEGDVECLAALMLDAYRGTIGDDGETIDDARREVESYFSGSAGETLLHCSWVSVENGRILSACLASLWQGAPLIAYIMTEALSKRCGLARVALNACLDCLKADGYGQVQAFIIEGNRPSENLFGSCGFLRGEGRGIRDDA
jgi:GNAT superfamily N-acetyltransferase